MAPVGGQPATKSFKKKKDADAEIGGFYGGPYWNRTSNLLIKSQLLCLVELTARIRCLSRSM